MLYVILFCILLVSLIIITYFISKNSSEGFSQSEIKADIFTVLTLNRQGDNAYADKVHCYLDKLEEFSNDTLETYVTFLAGSYAIATPENSNPYINILDKYGFAGKSTRFSQLRNECGA